MARFTQSGDGSGIPGPTGPQGEPGTTDYNDLENKPNINNASIDWTANHFQMEGGENTRYLAGDVVHQNGSLYVANFDNEANVAITTLSAAADGTVAEDLNSIKFNAPRAFTTQERAVTAEDYENLLKANYPEINAVIAYGGEDATPPQYGRIFVSVDLTDVDGLPKIKEDEYKRFLRSRSSVAMEPLFITPDYTYLKVDSTVRYNINTNRYCRCS